MPRKGGRGFATASMSSRASDPSGRRRSNPYPSYYRALLEAYGRQRWWPARSRFEVIVGAILTQNVAWANVEKAIAALRRAGLLSPREMLKAPVARLESLIRPAGFYRQKARTLRRFLALLEGEHGMSLGRLLGQPAEALRSRLIDLRGIGPETADSIVLYAAGRPVFVIDAYTRRVLGRHRLLGGRERYDEARRIIESAMPRRASLYGEYHALLVRVAKERCHKNVPDCRGCPLERFLPAGGAPTASQLTSTPCVG